MLVITNGKLLVDPAMNAEKMSDFITQLEGNIENLFGEELKFEMVEKPFLMYKVPPGLEWKKFMDCIPSESRIELMGIGQEDEVIMPYPMHRTVKHVYTIEELKTIADKMCEVLSEISKLESEKKAHAKRYSDKISALNDELKQEADEHRVGYQMQDKNVNCIMNFGERMKYYHLSSNGELVDKEEMTDRDQRTLFDIKGYDPNKVDDDDITGFEITAKEEVIEAVEGLDDETQDSAMDDFIKDQEENIESFESEKQEHNPDDAEQATSMENDLNPDDASEAINMEEV